MACRAWRFFVLACALVIAACGATRPLLNRDVGGPPNFDGGPFDGGDGGEMDAGQVLTCAGTVQSFCSLGNAPCLETWSDVEALSCGNYGCLAGVFTDACGGYRVVTCGAGDRAYSAFFDADSGVLVAALEYGGRPTPSADCNTDSMTFVDPGCGSRSPLPKCASDGG